MFDRRLVSVVLVAALVGGTGCSRGSRPPNTTEAAQKELNELEIARKKEWVPPDP